MLFFTYTYKNEKSFNDNQSNRLSKETNLTTEKLSEADIIVYFSLIYAQNSLSHGNCFSIYPM